MYARILEGQLADCSGEDVLTYFRLSVGPALRRQPGFLGGRLFADAGSAEWLLLLLWESDAQRARADADAVLQTLLGHLALYFAGPLRIRSGELKAQVSLAPAGC